MPQAAVLDGTRMWLCVSRFRWQSVEVVWDGFQLAGIHVGRTKTGILEPREAVLQDLTLFGGT